MFKEYISIPLKKLAIEFKTENMRIIEDELQGKFGYKDGRFFIKTLEGLMEVHEGDFIIKGIKGEFYPCKADIFHKSYTEIQYWEVCNV